MPNVVTLIKDIDSPLYERELKIDEVVLTYEVKRYFKWLNASKSYKNVIDRLCGLDSKTYNTFINHLIKKGY